MDELQKIYEMWSEEQEERSDIKNEWIELLEYLYEHCSEMEREEIAGKAIEYGRLIEQYAFQAGFCKAVRLFLEVLKIDF